jgi:hypothetical protein
MADRIGARVFSLQAGHVPFLSKPKETARVIFAAANFVRKIDYAVRPIAPPREGE